MPIRTTRRSTGSTAVAQRAIDEDLPADVASAWEPMFSDGVRIPMKVQYAEAPAHGGQRVRCSRAFGRGVSNECSYLH